MKLFFCVLMSLLWLTLAQAQTAEPITAQNVANLTLIRAIDLPRLSALNHGQQAMVVFTNDGESLVYAKDSQLFFIDIATGNVLHSIEKRFLYYITSLIVSHDENYVAVTTPSELCIWEVPTDTILLCKDISLKQGYEPQEILSLAFDSTSENLYLLSTFKPIFKYDQISQVIIHTFDLAAGNETDRRLVPNCPEALSSFSIKLNPTASHIVCSNSSLQQIDFRSTETLERLGTYRPDDLVHQVQFSADGTKVFVTWQCCFASGTLEGKLTILDLTTMEELSRVDLPFGTHGVPLYQSNDGILGYGYRLPEILNIVTNEVVYQTEGIASFNADGTLLVSATNKIYIYGLATCFVRATRDVNTRLEPSVEAQIGIVMESGEQYAVFESQKIVNETWWQTGEGYWVREDVIDLECSS